MAASEMLLGIFIELILPLLIVALMHFKLSKYPKPFKLDKAMSFKLSSIGTWKIRECGMCIESPDLHSSMERLKGPIEQTRRNFINC